MKTREDNNTNNDNIKMEKKKVVKLKYKNILLFFVLLIIIGYVVYSCFHLNITNIYISGNSSFSDQEIIDLAGIENYPSIITNNFVTIKNRLVKNDMIINAKVHFSGLTKVYIEVEENRPLFYNSNTNKTVMLDKKELSLKEDTPYLINYVPDTVYSEFINKMSKVPVDVLNRISEILYDPNEVDTERFYLTMEDGNYVYLTLNTFSKINNYVSIVKQFNNKKGILYLDSGEYFEIK